MVKVLPVDGNIVDTVLNSEFSDFEDGLQYYTAGENDMFAIVTRNIKDYKEKKTGMIIQTSSEFIKTNQGLLEENRKKANGA